MRKYHTNIITDPIEETIANALINADVQFSRPVDGLDFELECGTQIECKAFYAGRIIKQLSKHKNVIVIQGQQAANKFAELLNKKRN